MKTENNLENKAKFFAQYWGQEIVKWNFSAGGHSSMKLTVDDIRLNAPNESDFFLELTPLSQITDEDAEYLGFNSNGLTVDDACFGMSPSGIFLDEQELNPEFLQTDADYLRSKGYAIPFLDLSVEDLVDYGWIKLKTE